MPSLLPFQSPMSSFQSPISSALFDPFRRLRGGSSSFNSGSLFSVSPFGGSVFGNRMAPSAQNRISFSVSLTLKGGDRPTMSDWQPDMQEWQTGMQDEQQIINDASYSDMDEPLFESSDDASFISGSGFYSDFDDILDSSMPPEVSDSSAKMVSLPSEGMFSLLPEVASTLRERASNAREKLVLKRPFPQPKPIIEVAEIEEQPARVSSPEVMLPSDVDSHVSFPWIPIAFAALATGLVLGMALAICRRRKLNNRSLNGAMEVLLNAPPIDTHPSLSEPIEVDLVEA
eukprot:gb/GEZN01006981.1/.p1 GENE.gb/GEZN01006981.1/~~gb/GEZN01006981.1/.p1  ORF type:complete len:320 (-),score=44.25 gb/GEZN01006981.1/:636-1496(-)